VTLGLMVIVTVLGTLYFLFLALSGYGATTGLSPVLGTAIVALLFIGLLVICGVLATPILWRRIRSRVQTRIRTRLTVSHVLVVTLSLLVFSAMMSVLYIWVLNASGVDFATQFQSVIAATIFVLLVIGVITACSIVVAMVASRYMSRRLTRQISELERATEGIAAGHLDRRVAVLSEDELGHLAARFNALAERLEELDGQRRSFVAAISHDLRTPLAIIRGHVDAQLRPPDDETPAAPEAFRAIEHEAMTLGTLVDDLFTLSRLEEAALAMQREPVDLRGLVEDVVRGIRPYALKVSRVSVNSMVPEQLPPVLGDVTRITQILNNLLHNAIRHTPEGGIVVAEAAAMDREGYVLLSVSDTGVGISPEDLPHIFDRFYQGESVRSGGAGLGLSIVKQLVEAQGGCVSAESSPGEGTTIMVTLPVTTTPEK
jgi:signal transduction histidine kinase